MLNSILGLEENSQCCTETSSDDEYLTSVKDLFFYEKSDLLLEETEKIHQPSQTLQDDLGCVKKITESDSEWKLNFQQSELHYAGQKITGNNSLPNYDNTDFYNENSNFVSWLIDENTDSELKISSTNKSFEVEPLLENSIPTDNFMIERNSSEQANWLTGEKSISIKGDQSEIIPKQNQSLNNQQTSVNPKFQDGLELQTISDDLLLLPNDFDNIKKIINCDDKSAENKEKLFSLEQNENNEDYSDQYDETNKCSKDILSFFQKEIHFFDLFQNNQDGISNVDHNNKEQGFSDNLKNKDFTGTNSCNVFNVLPIENVSFDFNYPEKFVEQNDKVLQTKNEKVVKEIEDEKEKNQVKKKKKKKEKNKEKKKEKKKKKPS